MRVEFLEGGKGDGWCGALCGGRRITFGGSCLWCGGADQRESDRRPSRVGSGYGRSRLRGVHLKGGKEKHINIGRRKEQQSNNPRSV